MPSRKKYKPGSRKQPKRKCRRPPRKSIYKKTWKRCARKQPRRKCREKPRLRVRQKCAMQKATTTSSEFNYDVMFMLVNKYEPTTKDIRRPMKDEELKELCLRLNCRVDMTRWNPVYDFKQHYLKKGTFPSKPCCQRRVLARAVNKHKHKIGKCTDAEIQKTRNVEWAYRKKENLLRLRLWKYEERKKYKRFW